MKLISTRQARALTGLSTAKLREWTSRRALIPADVPPKAQGSPAQYGWQTILLLRLAVKLREHFNLELQAHRRIFDGLQCQLREIPFETLWGKILAVYGPDRWSLLDPDDRFDITDDVLLIRLDPHLELLVAGFAVPRLFRAKGQLDFCSSSACSGQEDANDNRPQCR